MRKLIAFQLFILIAFVAVFPAVVFGTPIAHLKLNSEPGDYVGQGGSFDIFYSAPDDTISAQIRRRLTDGSPAELLFELNSPAPGNQSALLFFGTDQLNIPIQAGTYTKAQRADFANPGHPGLDVLFQDRVSNTLTGYFTIFDVTFVQDPLGECQIATFDAKFLQHSGGSVPVLSGRFHYNMSGISVPEPASLLLLGSGLIGLAGLKRKLK